MFVQAPKAKPQSSIYLQQSQVGVQQAPAQARKPRRSVTAAGGHGRKQSWLANGDAYDSANQRVHQGANQRDSANHERRVKLPAPGSGEAPTMHAGINASLGKADVDVPFVLSAGHRLEILVALFPNTSNSALNSWRVGFERARNPTKLAACVKPTTSLWEFVLACAESPEEKQRQAKISRPLQVEYDLSFQVAPPIASDAD